MQHLPQHVFFPDDFEVIGEVQSGGGFIHQVVEVSQAPDILQLIAISQALGEGENINRLLLVEQFGK